MNIAKFLRTPTLKNFCKRRIEELKNFFYNELNEIILNVLDFKVIESRYKQCGITPDFSASQNLLNKNIEKK